MGERQLRIPEKIRQIVAMPDWYNHVGRIKRSVLLGGVVLDEIAGLTSGEGTVKSRTKRLVVRVIEQLLNERAVQLGAAGPNWDEERRQIDTIVVHHTSSSRPLRLSYLNALHLLQLYVPKYQNPGPEESLIGGAPIYSGHADAEGQQVFYGYHWLVRSDGATELLLPDSAIGWQAGNWDVNCRSVAICFDADLQNNRPTQPALHAAAQIVAEHYPNVPIEQIRGHKDVKPSVATECPGAQFGQWGEELRALIAAREA